MRSLVVGALFEALPGQGVACLRFNFRGVEGSEGSHGSGEEERLDVEAAIGHLHDHLPAGVPIVVMGWSFGADVAAAVRDARHAGWFLVAPPLQYSGALGEIAGDPRPKRLALAEHDQFRDPADVQVETAGWVNARTDVVGGADHFFIGRTERLVDLAVAFVDEVVETEEAAGEGGA